MYTLRLLGLPWLEGPDGPVSGRVTQERKLAVLAVLALSEGRTRTRDSLAAMFWPDFEAGKARHNVADTVWVIRSALGQQAVVADGNRITLNPEVVATDVEHLRQALAQGNLEAVQELHPDRFMDGFHISGAPDFEHWMDAERARLAASHGDALETLTQTALVRGRPAEAARWARRLAAADPLNTRHALLYMSALANSGDVAGAVLHGAEHADLLKEELGIQPPPELEAFSERLRTGPVPGLAPSASASALARPASDLPVPRSDPLVPASVPSSPAARPSHRMVARGGALLAVALLVGALVTWVAPRESSGDHPDLVDDRIVVVAFENRTGDPQLDLLGRLVADVLTRGLAQAGIGEVVLPTEMLAPGAGPEGTPTGPRQARAVAADLLAGISVSGSIDPGPLGPVLVTLIATGPGSRVAAGPDPVPVDPEQPGPALEQLNSRVVGTLAAHLGQALPEHPFVVRTPSYESYRVADRATSLYLERRFDRAAALFRRAFELDSTAVGYLLWEAVAHQNRRDSPRVWQIVEELRPRRDELTPFDAAHYDWLEARVLGDLRGSLQAARRAHALHPHSGLGGVQFGLELLRSGHYEEAVEAFTRLDPYRGWLAGFLYYWYDLADAYHVLGRHDEELSVAEEGYLRFPGPELLGKRLRALAALGRTLELEQALRESTDPPAHALIAAQTLHRHGLDSLSVAMAEEGLRGLAAMPESDRLAHRRTEAQLLLAAGRLEEARAVLLERLGEDPMDWDLLGWTGFVEARLGLEAEARTRIEALRVLGREPFARGGPTVARAAIHAELGDDPARVRLLLEQGHREGWGMHLFHFTPLLDPVREHPDVRGSFTPVSARARD